MIYYCISDIHGCLKALNKALELILPHLSGSNTALILLGDYVHGGEDDYGVLDRIISLQNTYGKEKIIVLAGNHDRMVCERRMTIDGDDGAKERDKPYINWLKALPLVYKEKNTNTVFVHAGVDEEAEDLWRVGTAEHIFTEKYPAQTGHFYGDLKIVAGHVHTSTIAGDPNFHGIYYDGESHYYIDADTISSGFLNILKVDTEKQEYYEVTEEGEKCILPYHNI